MRSATRARFGRVGCAAVAAEPRLLSLPELKWHPGGEGVADCVLFPAPTIVGPRPLAN